MHPSLSAATGVSHHSMVSRGECDLLARELRTDLLSVSSKDERVIQLRKDLQQFKNKAPDTLAAILTDAFNRDQPVARRLASTISGFFSARTRIVRRKWRELRAAETRIEGQMNCTELELDQGDRSRVRILEMKSRIHEYRGILDEEEAALDEELYRAGSPQ